MSDQFLDLKKIEDEVRARLSGTGADTRIATPDTFSSVASFVPKRVTLSDNEIGAMGEFLETKSSNVENATPQVAPRGGIKHDSGKPRWDIFMFDAAEGVVEVLTWACNKSIRGEKAYPERNWELGMSWGRVFGAMIRHAWKWWFAKMRGDEGVDDESGISHAKHFACCALMLVAYELRQHHSFDDRPTPLTKS